MTNKERRDKRFRKLCKWMSEAGEIAEILREECAQICHADQQGWNFLFVKSQKVAPETRKARVRVKATASA